MRFMILIKATEESEAGELPSEKALAAMLGYNEELHRAGVLVTAEGLEPSASGARVKISSGTSTVVDGPFTEAKELVGGFWIIQVSSREEALEWAQRCPGRPGGETVLEVRRVLEAPDFGDEFTPELREAEERLRENLPPEDVN